MRISPPPATLPKDFYVYEHRKATTGEVFYIGKGKNGRAWIATNRKRHWLNIAKKHGVVVRIIKDGLQEWFAHELERDLIALHGRMDCGLGPLVNVTDGGEGSSGVIVSDETRRKMSEAFSGTKHPMYGKPMPQSVKDKIAASRNGKPLTEAHKQTLRDRHAFGGRSRPAQADAVRGEKNGRCRPVLCLETGSEFPYVKAAQIWLLSQGRRGSVYNCCYGFSRSAGGYTWRFKE
jgi:NUMOD3 motif